MYIFQVLTGSPEHGRFLLLTFIYFVTVIRTSTMEQINVINERFISVNLDSNVTLRCASSQSNTKWRFQSMNIQEENESLSQSLATKLSETSFSQATKIPTNNNISYEHFLNIKKVLLTDEGNYTCFHSKKNVTKELLWYYVQPVIQPKFLASTLSKIKRKIGQSVVLYCLLEAYPIDSSLKMLVKWKKDGETFSFLDSSTSITQKSRTNLNITLELTEVYKKENGTYACEIKSKNGTFLARKEIVLLVMDVPQVSIDYVKPVGASRIFLNWTVNDGNDPIQKYFVQFLQEGTPTFTYYNHVIGGKNVSYVLENFQPNTSYLLRMSAKNSIGDGVHNQYPQSVKTLVKDPLFIPKVQTTGSTASTITIGWASPPIDLTEYIQYYELVILEAGDNPRIVEEVIYQQNSRNLPYMFDNLKTATAYEFKVRACCDLTKICGPWSKKVNGTTMDGISTPPTDLKISCSLFNISRQSAVTVSWNLPKNPNGKIVSYLIQLDGKSTYSLDGKNHDEFWGPKIRRVDEPHRKTIYEGVTANTNYSVSVSAITRHKKTGQTATGSCTMPISVPDSISRITWTKVKTNEKCVFKVLMPKISERNGRICCYRIYLIRLKEYYRDLPNPGQLNVSTYHEVHSKNNTFGGAYIAEIISGDNYRSEIFLGDGKRLFENDPVRLAATETACHKCLNSTHFQRIRKQYAKAEQNKITLAPNINSEAHKHQTAIILELSQRKELARAGNLTQAASEILNNKKRLTRSPKLLNYNIYQDLKIYNLLSSTVSTAHESLSVGYHVLPYSGLKDVFDGEVDMNSNYSGYVEFILRDDNGPEADKVLFAYSNYFDTMTPRTPPTNLDVPKNISLLLNVVIQTLVVLIGLVLILLIVLCFMHRHYTKRSIQGDEAVSLRDSLSRALCGGRTHNHRHLIGSSLAKSADGPILKLDLPQAYANRHKDTDYGFLREYELLPSRFNDRTTKNSDLKENSNKNRYPDIKAYDQTRVKLSQNNAVQGSDYINANFVIGYKERKKFICAQGPLEGTIIEFWRMIWEQHLEIIIMLTNLEEYNKTKCAKYWPEQIADSKQFGEITVTFVSESRYSEFLVRNMDVRRSSLSEVEDDRRKITQYHYLVWKDFMAPEHPYGIIKFIRQINSVYSVQRGPILVHCSAGVGRTGTLVALDSLIHQLEEEDQVAVFNTVCDLRRQRNFLVQSLRQYIFLYRALLDIAQFGNTEISALGLSQTVEHLKAKSLDNKEKCKLEYEFEKIKSIDDETNKSCAIGNGEENMLKNRTNLVIPYDRNRVILTPIPNREHSSYINASFIEAYNNLDSFIITQDPMENTVEDFWRMMSEQSVTTLVTISEIGDGPKKCPRYWVDDEVQYDHVIVKYIHSESCPYYTRREFHVTNCKIDDTNKVTQFQYNGWPTVEGEVPEVCRGIIELVDQSLKHHAMENIFSSPAPIAVHCSTGTDRSSIFVAMCILVQQLRTEKKIDICTITRKLRSQRAMLLNTYAQYEFLHRAIAIYADLHKLSLEVSTDC